MARRRYTVKFEHGDRPNQWLASLVEIPQVHTFGRGLRQTRERIREALEVWFEDKVSAEDIDFKEVFPLPAREKRRLEKLREIRAQGKTLLTTVVDDLVSLGWSARDVGSVLGLSHQRVSQVATKKKRSAKKKARKATTKKRRNALAGSRR